jgi:hypothetical protein
MADNTIAVATAAEELVNAAFTRIHGAIDRACAIAEANVDNPVLDWKIGARLHLDFCTFAMRRAQPEALSNPNKCAGEIRRSRVCLKKIKAGIPPGVKFPQAIIDATHDVSDEIDAAMVELKAARELNRQTQNG